MKSALMVLCAGCRAALGRGFEPIGREWHAADQRPSRRSGPHRQATLAAMTVFAIGASLAAEPLSPRADLRPGPAPQALPFGLGHARPPTSQDPDLLILAPPR